MIIEFIDLKNWKKQDAILTELHREWGINISSREWRKEVEEWNKKFCNKEVDYYITHSNSLGYKATQVYEEAKIAINDYKKRAFNMLKKASECDKAFGNKNNYQINFDEGKIQ